VLYRQLGANMSELTKAIAELQQKKIIHVVKYRKSERMGLDVPVYSLMAGKNDRMDVHSLLAGITSERLVEYDFVAKNLVSPDKGATLLDIGSAGSDLAQAMRDFGKRWQVFGIDIAPGSDATMDARSTGFADAAFDQVISISTIEHVDGDLQVMKEILRLLKKGGSTIITVPYGKSRQEHKIYDRNALAKLASGFSISKTEFYRYDSGKWVKCSQAAADRVDVQVPAYLHSAVCACLLLKKGSEF